MCVSGGSPLAHLSSTIAFLYAIKLDGVIQVNASLATPRPNNSLPTIRHHEGHEEHEDRYEQELFTTC